MPRAIALEWDNAEIRFIAARLRGDEIDFERIAAVSLRADEAKTPAAIGAKIRGVLKDFGIAKCDALVSVSRANLELRFLNVPPVPADELTEVVRFQASRQFSQSVEEGLLDYSPLSSSGDPPTVVLAAAIPPELLKTIREAFTAAELPLKHIVLRPFAADSLLHDRLTPESCVLTLDPLAEELDLTVMLGPQAVFPRTVRISQHATPEEQATAMVMEIRRTIAAAQNQLAGRRVERIFIFSSASDHGLLASTIVKELGIQAEFVDPFGEMQLSPETTARLPRNAGSFAPLVGMLRDEARKHRHEIDFLAPRKKPDPPDRRLLYGLAGTAIALAVLVPLFFTWRSLGALDEEIESLRLDSIKYDKLLKAAKPKLEHAKLIDEFAAGRVPWLAELGDMSSRMPPAQEVIVRDLTLGAQREGGSLVLQGGAKQSGDIPKLESSLRDEAHRISGSGGSNNPLEPNYPWSFREVMQVAPRPEEPEKNAKPASVTADSAANASEKAGKS